MTDPDELRITLGTIADVLSRLSVPWAIGGSVASAAYGEPRSTNDIDIIVKMGWDLLRT